MTVSARKPTIVTKGVEFFFLKVLNTRDMAELRERRIN
jgi:hypothetical protein